MREEGGEGGVCQNFPSFYRLKRVFFEKKKTIQENHKSIQKWGKAYQLDLSSDHELSYLQHNHYRLTLHQSSIMPFITIETLLFNSSRAEARLTPTIKLVKKLVDRSDLISSKKRAKNPRDEKRGERRRKNQKATHIS